MGKENPLSAYITASFIPFVSPISCYLILSKLELIQLQVIYILNLCF